MSFKLSGPKGNIPEGWKLLDKVIDMDEPHDPDLYLGCVHRFGERSVDSKTIRMIEFDHAAFLESCIQLYLQLALPGTKLKSSPTPFLEEQLKLGPRAVTAEGPWHECPWCRTRAPEASFLEGKGKGASSCADGSCFWLLVSTSAS